MSARPPGIGFGDRLTYVHWLRNRERAKRETFGVFAEVLGISAGWVDKWKKRYASPPGHKERDAMAVALREMSIEARWLYEGEGEPPSADLWNAWFAERVASGDSTAQTDTRVNGASAKVSPPQKIRAAYDEASALEDARLDLKLAGLSPRQMNAALSFIQSKEWRKGWRALRGTAAGRTEEELAEEAFRYGAKVACFALYIAAGARIQRNGLSDQETNRLRSVRAQAIAGLLPIEDEGASTSEGEDTTESAASDPHVPIAAEG